MFQFVGYDFFSDGDALENAPTNIKDVSKSRLTNAIFDHFNITRKIDEPFSTVIPTEWNYETVLNGDFNGDLNAGNVEGALSQISKIRVQYRKKGEFDWIVLAEVDINSYDDLIFTLYSRYNLNNTEYEFAFVPILHGTQGNIIINSIVSNFRGVFISDADTSYQFFFGSEYGTETRVQQVGTFEPLGRKYPILVSNGAINYDMGTLSGMVLADDYEETRTLDREANIQKKKKVIDWLTNHKPKILKDQNGNIWLVGITDAIQTNYAQGSGKGLPVVNISWQEIGDANSNEDLADNNLVSHL